MTPTWFKWLYGAFLLVLVPLYWRAYGPANFLWFSDLALLLTFVALVLESRLLLSMVAVGVLLPELAWNLDFLAGLLTGGHSPVGLAGYMFESDNPLWLRGLSLFHVPLPLVLLWGLWHTGYDPRALRWQIGVSWVVLPLSRLFSTPEHNVNWVYGPGAPQTLLPDGLYLLLLMALVPLVLVPTHVLLRRLFPESPRARQQ